MIIINKQIRKSIK